MFAGGRRLALVVALALTVPAGVSAAAAPSTTHGVLWLGGTRAGCAVVSLPAGRPNVSFGSTQAVGTYRLVYLRRLGGADQPDLLSGQVTLRRGVVHRVALGETGSLPSGRYRACLFSDARTRSAITEPSLHRLLRPQLLPASSEVWRPSAVVVRRLPETTMAAQHNVYLGTHSFVYVAGYQVVSASSPAAWDSTTCIEPARGTCVPSASSDPTFGTGQSMTSGTQTTVDDQYGAATTGIRPGRYTVGWTYRGTQAPRQVATFIFRGTA
jgi:hypothetical protein